MRVRVGGEQKKLNKIIENSGQQKNGKKAGRVFSIYLPQEGYQPPIFEVSPREHNF